jgi:hypothetical protein
MTQNRVFMLFVLVLLVAPGVSYGQAECYIAYTESESEMSLRLSEDGRAVKITEVWQAGEYYKRDTMISHGEWVLTDRLLTVTYGSDKKESYLVFDAIDIKREDLKIMGSRLLQNTVDVWCRLWLKNCSDMPLFKCIDSNERIVTTYSY